MMMYGVIIRSLRRSPTSSAVGAISRTSHFNLQNQHFLQNPNFSIPLRSFAFSSAEEAAAERRRRKRRLRIEPPLFALQRQAPSNAPYEQKRDGPRLPDSTSALTGPRLNLHNRVQSLIRADDLDSASATARYAVFSNVRPTVFTCNAIIAAMHRNGRNHEAKALFQYFFNQFDIIPNVVSYNFLIVSHCASGEVDEGLKVYQQILENAPFSPSHVTYRHLTKGLVDAGRIGEAVDLLREMLNKGHGADSLVYNNLISGFLELGNLDKANELFDELKERCTVYDGVVNATFMEWFFKQGKEKEALDSYKSLLDRKFRMVPPTCNALIEVLLRYGRTTEAWALFEEMLDNHTPPTFQAVNSDTFNIMVNESFKEGKISEALDVFKKAGKAAKSKPFAMDVAGFNNMITRLCELEMMEEAERYYAELCGKSLSPDVTTYRTMIDAYVKLEQVDGALDKYDKMVEQGLRVIPKYANKWFTFLCEKGKVDECLPILMKMAGREQKPDVTTYEIIIKRLCEDNKYHAGFDILSQMMNCGVGITAKLKEYVLEVYEKIGRRHEVEKLLTQNPFNSPYLRPSGPSRIERQGGSPQHPPGQRGGPQMPWKMPAGPPQSGWTAVSPQVVPGQGPTAYQMPSSQVSVSPQMQGAINSASQMSWQSSASIPGQVRPHTVEGEAQRIPTMPGQVPESSQMGGQGVRYPQVPGYAGGPQMPWQVDRGAGWSTVSHQVPPRQGPVAYQMSQSQSSGSHQMAGGVTSATQMSWQSSTSPQNSGWMGPQIMEGEAQPLPTTPRYVPEPSQMGGQEVRHMQVPGQVGGSHMPWQAAGGPPRAGWSPVSPQMPPWQGSITSQTSPGGESWQSSVPHNSQQGIRHPTVQGHGVRPPTFQEQGEPHPRKEEQASEPLQVAGQRSF